MVAMFQSGKSKEQSRSFTVSLSEVLLVYFPDIKKKLSLASLTITPQDFMIRVIKSTFLLSVSLLFLSVLFFLKNSMDMIYIIPLLFVYPVIMFFYFMLYPDVMVLKRQSEIDYEILFAGRHLVIGLKSGMSLFDALVGVSKGNYGQVSKEFARIVESVGLGIPLSQAVREAAHINPSKYFVRLLVQMSNSISSGADVGDSLDAVLDQISKEQIIQLREYGQKLTPIVMFFMVFGIILPSLGVVLSIVLFSVISGGKLGITSSILLLVFGFIAVVQFLFLGVIESSRPKYLI